MKTQLLVLFLFIGLCLFSSCQQDAANNNTTDIVDIAPLPATAEGFEQVWQTDTVFQTPESVVYDPANRKLYVSNIVGVPDQKDGQGFISVVDLNGKVEQLKWINGFDAPKGLYIQDDLLYVADIDQVVIVSILEGTILRKIAFPDAQFLNAITFLPGSDVILVTDTNTNRIYWLDADGRVGIWLEDEALSHPNGIFYHDKSLLIASFSSEQVLSVDPIGLTIKRAGTGIGAGDGILISPQGDTLVSDWGGRVFQLAEGQAKLLADLRSLGENAADMEWVEKENLLVVPTFFGNSLRAFRMEEK